MSYLETLNKFLLEQVTHGFDVVLIIDEAQNLSFELLEQIRLLSNLEIDQGRLPRSLDPMLHLLQGEIYQARRTPADLRKAREEYQKAVVTGQVASPALQWLLHNHEVDYGLARVEAFLREPPAREPGERALAYHYLGTRYTALRRLDSAADAYAHAAELAPSPRLLYDWAIAEADRGRLEKSREVLLRLVGKAAPMAQAWLALAQVSLQLGDTTGARAAAESTLALAPGQGEAQRLLEGISRR